MTSSNVICRCCGGRKVVRRSDGKWVKCGNCSGTLTRARALQEAREGLRRCRDAYAQDRSKRVNLEVAIRRCSNAGMDNLEIRRILGWSNDSLLKFISDQGRTL